MFSTPSAYYLLLLLIVPYMLYRALSKRRNAAITFSSTDAAAGMPKSWRQKLIWLPPTLGALGLALMIISLARPQEGRKEAIVESEGIAIEMVVDRSGSMQAMDFDLKGQPVDRLTAIKDVAGKFIQGSDELDGRASDLIGLITFAGQSDAQVPPTLDHTFLNARLNNATIVTKRSEDGTAIGDAIGLAVEKLTNLDELQQSKQREAVKSKVIILMTDGENNAGSLDPIPAAELAKTLGIKVYTIGVGTNGLAPVPVANPFTGRESLQMVEVKIDEETLKKVADETGGKYFRATDTDSLAAIYAEIDEMEKSEVEARHLMDYRELAVEPIHLGALTLPPLLLLAMFSLLGQVVLSNTVLRQL
jgi:Ca-activated chloride channel family protein